MAEPIQGFDFDPRNGHFHCPREYGSRLSWPLQHSDNETPSSAAMIPKRSTSPLPLPLDSRSFQQTATYPPPSVMATEWQVTSQAPPVSFPLDTTSYPQQAFESYGASFHASPTDYITQQATLEASLEANMNPNMSAGLPMDQTYMTMGSAMPNDMNDASQNMDMVSMPIQWSDFENIGTNLYPDFHNILQQQQQPLPQMGSPSTYTNISETHEVRSLSSNEGGWNMIDPIDPHAGAIFNPQQTLHLHPRTYSDSSSDDEQHSHSSSDSFVKVSHCASSPSNDSTGELHFPSDYELERPSPPVAMANVLVPPISTAQSTSSNSPQHSPTSPPSRNRSRKGTTTKTAASTKGISKKPMQGSRAETTEKRVGRRKGPLRPDQRKQASEIRKLGACIRCRFLKKTVSRNAVYGIFSC